MLFLLKRLGVFNTGFSAAWWSCRITLMENRLDIISRFFMGRFLQGLSGGSLVCRRILVAVLETIG